MRSPISPLVVLLLLSSSLTVACQSAEPSLRARGGHGHASARPSVEEPAPIVAPSAPTPAPARVAAAEPSREGWNEAQIDWQPYEAGLAQARATNRPVCIVFSADWCPHCRGYSHVFEDPRIVEAARGFVMIHVDSDAQREVASRYAVDGGYVPRTYFLDPTGTAMTDVVARTDRFHYFFDEHDPASLLAGMTRAQRRHGG